MKLYVFIRRRIAVSAKKDGFKQHCFKQPCLICFFFAIFAEDNQKSCISLIISIVVSTVLFMVTI